MDRSPVVIRVTIRKVLQIVLSLLLRVLLERCGRFEPSGFARGFHRGGKPNPIVKLLDYRLKI